MKIDWLKIPDYGNLKDFEINFDESQPITVLLGHNGSGKSNLIEAIIEIIRDLDLGRPPSFTYTIQYICHDNTVMIDANPSRQTKRLDITINSKTVTQADFRRDLARYLPNYVFAYYSGWSSRLERHFNEPTQRYYREVLKSSHSEMPLRRLFFCRKEYSQLVLLAFFLAEFASVRDLLRDYLSIKHFDSALFVLKKPWWRGSGAPNKAQLAEGDPRFWHARGAFKIFLDRLWNIALAPIRSNDELVERDVRRQAEATDRLYLYIKNSEELSKLKVAGEETKILFGYLESLYLCDLLDEVRITVERTDGTCIKFSQLSEGEQQLLTVLGLMLFTQNDESLYLLDEPDTHLNPVWTYDFLNLLQQNIRAEKGQLVIATHNPLMIGSLHKNQVRILKQEGLITRVDEPMYNPIGIGVEGLLKSELYGLRSTLAPEILKKLDDHYLLLGKPNKTPQEQLELMRLATEINSLGVSRTHPNPYFEHFANAMAKRSATDQTTLTREEIDAQTALADDILAEILADEKSSHEENS